KDRKNTAHQVELEIEIWVQRQPRIYRPIRKRIRQRVSGPSDRQDQENLRCPKCQSRMRRPPPGKGAGAAAKPQAKQKDGQNNREVISRSPEQKGQQSCPDTLRTQCR